MKRYFQTHLPIWEHLTHSEKDRLMAASSEEAYEKGTCVHNGDDLCIGVIAVRSGQLRTYMLSEDGRDITLFRIGPGEVCILSASCVLDAITFDVCIDAEEDTRAILIDSATYQEMAQENIYMKCYAYEIAANRFSDVMWAMEQILFMSMDRRLALFLHEESVKANSLTLHLTHEQIARLVGSAREVVSRMLKYFEQEGVVQLGRGEVSILSMNRLKALAGQPVSLK